MYMYMYMYMYIVCIYTNKGLRMGGLENRVSCKGVKNGRAREQSELQKG